MKSSLKVCLMFVLTTGCIAPTRLAGIRRVAESRLHNCLLMANTKEARNECLQDSYAFCSAALKNSGWVEKGCGLGWQ